MQENLETNKGQTKIYIFGVTNCVDTRNVLQNVSICRVGIDLSTRTQSHQWYFIMHSTA